MSPKPSIAMSAVQEEEAIATAAPVSPSESINNKHKQSTNNNNNNNKIPIAKLISATSTSLHDAGQHLRSGNLVSFPTETVYGLGCHALDPIAVQKVFDAKERPLSDPLIVHVCESDDALKLWDASSSSSTTNDGATINGNDADDEQQQTKKREIEKQALSTITSSFFPGPLTIVARANPTIPQILMANTGYVACRSPSHPIARSLLQYAKVPIAAPSANKFGHVSPTLASHVYDDLKFENVWIVDPMLGVDDKEEEVNSKQSLQNDDTTVCQVGVESTVAKIEMHSSSSSSTSTSSSIMGSITILRHGAISSQSIRDVLQKSNLLQYFDVYDSVKFTSEKVCNVAPGQTVKHYSPNVPCFMISTSRQQRQQQQDDEVAAQEEGGEEAPLQQQHKIFNTNKEEEEEERTILSQSVIIDYGKRLQQYEPYALAYRDVSPNGNGNIAASNIFEALRWSETVKGALRVFVPEIVVDDDEKEKGGNDDDGVGENGNNDDNNRRIISNDEDDEDGNNNALVLAVKDKLTRAASAVVLDVFK